MIRLIVVSSENGEREEVIFTEDMNTPAEHFFFMGGKVTGLTVMTVDTDEKIKELPLGFPMEYVLVRKGGGNENI